MPVGDRVETCRDKCLSDGHDALSCPFVFRGPQARRARASHNPPPISTLPDSRASSRARSGRTNQARPRPSSNPPPGVQQGCHHDKYGTHDGKLQCRRQGGIDKLRQKGGEKSDRLRVEQRHPEAAGEMHTLRQLPALSRPHIQRSPGLNTEPDRDRQLRPSAKFQTAGRSDSTPSSDRRRSAQSAYRCRAWFPPPPTGRRARLGLRPLQ